MRRLTLELTGTRLRVSERPEGVMLNDLLYVLAGRADEAKLFAESRNVPFMKMRFIDRPDKIRGLRNIKLHVLSSASEREDFHEIMQEAKYRCFEIENV